MTDRAEQRGENEDDGNRCEADGGLFGNNMKIDNDARQRSSVPMPICKKVRRRLGNAIRQSARPTMRGRATTQIR